MFSKKSKLIRRRFDFSLAVSRLPRQNAGEYPCIGEEGRYALDCFPGKMRGSIPASERKAGTRSIASPAKCRGVSLHRRGRQVRARLIYHQVAASDIAVVKTP